MPTELLLDAGCFGGRSDLEPLGPHVSLGRSIVWQTGVRAITGLALRLVLTAHIGIPHESQPDFLRDAEQVFAPKKPKPAKATPEVSSKPKPTVVKSSAKKEAARKKAA